MEHTGCWITLDRDAFEVGDCKMKEEEEDEDGDEDEENVQTVPFEGWVMGKFWPTPTPEL